MVSCPGGVSGWEGLVSVLVRPAQLSVCMEAQDSPGPTAVRVGSPVMPLCIGLPPKRASWGLAADSRHSAPAGRLTLVRRKQKVQGTPRQPGWTLPPGTTPTGLVHEVAPVYSQRGVDAPSVAAFPAAAESMGHSRVWTVCCLACVEHIC